MKIVNTLEAKNQLSRLLAAVERRDEVVLICRGGRPVAEMRKVSTRKDPLRKHPKLSRILFREDPVAALDPKDWPDADLS